MSVAEVLLARLLESDDADPCVIAFVATLVTPTYTGTLHRAHREQCGASMHVNSGRCQLGYEDSRCTKTINHTGPCHRNARDAL